MSKREQLSASRNPRQPSGSSRREFMQQAALGAGIAATLPFWTGALGAEPTEQQPSSGQARVNGARLLLGNDVIAAEWEASTAGLRLTRVEDRRSRAIIAAALPAFALVLKESVVLDAGKLKLVAAPRAEPLKGDPRASRLSERLDGWQLVAILRDGEGKVQITWRAILCDASHYIRQEVTIRAEGTDLPLEEICLVDLRLPNASVGGTVRGSPVTAGSWFFGFEHPLSTSAVGGSRVRCSLGRQLPLKAGQSATYSSVIGAAPPGQLRRGFLQYVERERAHPYRPFLHYNSWYDLGYFTPFDEASALAVVEAFGRELHERRGVTLDSFLFDDGWDDHKLWGFNSGFPRGFAPLKEATARHASAPGVWLSPWGGYGKPRQERLKFGKEQGFETNEGGFALSGPVYYRRFREVCLEMVRAYGVNQFKFDGTGNAASVIPGSAFGSDFEAAISLIGDLRAEKPDLYVNLTTGTYPSPFWLWHADSTWRGGNDHDFAGVGTDRQRWITYRDAQTFRNVVQRGPLYPLNALMLHGLIFARHAKKLDTDSQDDFDAEVRSYFGSGTQLQEMYITHTLLSERHWDTLAEAANWSRRNAEVLVDTHWVGGDPARLEVYGWASWSPNKGILTLRNPGGNPQSFEVDASSIFELPGGAARRYLARSPWKKDQASPPVELRAGRLQKLDLQPFEVLTLEATP